MPTIADAATVENGSTNIVIWWDYLQATEIISLPGFAKGWKVVSRLTRVAAYYSQAVSKVAPDPAAARLWEEYLYSPAGQDLWLAGTARPTSSRTWSPTTGEPKGLAALPPAPASVTNYPTKAQLVAAKAVVAADWSTEKVCGA